MIFKSYQEARAFMIKAIEEGKCSPYAYVAYNEDYDRYFIADWNYRG